MTEAEVQERQALDEVLAWNGVVHVFPRERISTRQNLKYMWVFRAAVIKVTAYVSMLYVITKDYSGPLKPGIERVEESVQRIVPPIYQKIHSKHSEMLAFLDRKVDKVVQFLDGLLPLAVKEFCWKAFDATKSTVDQVHNDGIYCTAKGLYDNYQPVVELYGIQAYRKALKIPLVPQAVACSRYGAGNINKIIITLKESGLPLMSFLPLLPVNYFDKIARSE